MAGPAAPAMATPEWRSAGNTFSIVRWEIRLPRGGPPVAGHHHAVGVADGHDGGAVGDVEPGGVAGRSPQRGSAPARRSSVEEARPGVVVGGRSAASRGQAAHRCRVTCEGRVRSGPRRSEPGCTGTAAPNRRLVAWSTCSAASADPQIAPPPCSTASVVAEVPNCWQWLAPSLAGAAYRCRAGSSLARSGRRSRDRRSRSRASPPWPEQSACAAVRIRGLVERSSGLTRRTCTLRPRSADGGDRELC